MRRVIWQDRNLCKGRLTPIGKKVPHSEIVMLCHDIGFEHARKQIDSALNIIERAYYNNIEKQRIRTQRYG